MPVSIDQSNSKRVRVSHLFSWKASERKAAEAILESASPDEKLAMLQAMLPVVSSDDKFERRLAWLMFGSVGTIISGAINHEHWGPTAIWISCVAVGATVQGLFMRGVKKRQSGVSTILDGASDYRIVPAALSYRVWLSRRFGSDSLPYRSLISVLERHMPQVTVENIGNNHSNWRWALTPFVEEKPFRPKLVIEALRLAPAYGNAATLRGIERLVTQYEWGADLPADECVRLNEAVVASAAALRETLERHNHVATLLRASDAAAEPLSISLLRASSGSPANNSDELLKAVEMKVEVR